jgi:lipopolysaccharide assembly protein B
MILHNIVIALLPVAAGCGWYIRDYANKSDARKLKQPARKYYFNGLNHIINEEADKAVDEFVKLIEVDDDTVETHLALGNLFRRRGEVDRAIRIHQNVVVRSGISEAIRENANIALARDYLKAGVLDRAEKMCLHLIKLGCENDAVLTLLLNVYQKERHWKKAIQIARKLQKTSEHECSVEIAHFYAELADDMFHLGQYDQMQVYLNHALKYDPSNVRIHLLLARISINKGQYEEALVCCKKVEENAITLLSYIIPKLLEKKELMPEGFLQQIYVYLNHIIKSNPFLFFVLSVDESFDLSMIEQRTFDLIFAHVKNDNTMERIHYLLCFQQLNSSGDSKLLSIHLREYMNKLIRENLIHRCHYCGFKTNILFWCCPGCDRWATATKRLFLLNSDEEKV